MKKLSLVLLFLLCPILLFSQTTQKPTVVVVPFDTKDISQDDVDIINELFISEYANTGKATVVDRNSFDKIQKELEFQSTDWSDSNKVAELGRALNANHVVTGQFLKFRDEIIFNVKVLDVNTVAILAAETVRIKDIAELFDLLPQTCKSLATKSAGGFVTEEINNTKQTSISIDNNSDQIYQIGDDGPGGGIIIYYSQKGFEVYETETTTKTCHYIEMSKEKFEMPFSSYDIPKTTKRLDLWKNYRLITKSKDIGSGKALTMFFIKNMIDISTTNNPEKFCMSYSTPTTSEGEWFLPCSIELQLLILYQNKLADKIDNNFSSYYWVSEIDFDISGDNYTESRSYNPISKIYHEYRPGYFDGSNKWHDGMYHKDEKSYVVPMRAF